MTTLLHLPARADAPIACDMTTARDTPAERLAEYGELFDSALLSRERIAGGVGFTFRDDEATRHQVEDLAHREHACCPFLDYRVEAVDDHLVWTITTAVTGADRASVDATLDAMHTLPRAPVG